MQGSCHPLEHSLLTAALLMAFCVTPALHAEESSAGGPLSKLTVHGFLTQGYADAKFAKGGFFQPTGTELNLGIPEDGTTNYRNLAIQFRYEISPKDTMIIQLSSRALGNSPIQAVEDDVELDWAFYERRLTDQTALKVGRIQVPLGIFNEIRDVGTILPFWRPAFSIYQEGTFTSETVDGLVLSHTFGGESDWSLDVDLYAGEWDLVEINPLVAQGGAAAVVARAKDVVGAQLWLNTPITGVRFGLGGNTKKIEGGLVNIFRLPGETPRWDDLYASVDVVRDKFVFRTEFKVVQTDTTAIFLGAEFVQGYYQLGYHINDKVRIYAQHEIGNADIKREDFRPFPLTVDVKNEFLRDTAIAINYLFSPNLVFKAEHHFNVESEQFSAVPVVTPSGLALMPIFANATDGTYTIISLSASF